MMSSSFWPGVCAFFGTFFAALVLVEFGVYVAARYRERYLQETRTELDDVLIQILASRILDLSIAFSIGCTVFIILLIMLFAPGTSLQAILLLSCIAGIVLFPLPRIILRFLKTRRINKFNLQLEDALNMISGALFYFLASVWFLKRRAKFIDRDNFLREGLEKWGRPEGM